MKENLKHDIRHKILNELKSWSINKREGQSLDLSKNLLLLLERLSFTSSLLTENLAVFTPLKTEPIWFSAFGDKWQKVNLLLPEIINETQMSFKKANLDDLKSLKLNWKDKNLNKEINEFNFILVPGVAFTKEGKRLGRGKGYYDRFLSSRSLVKIGIAFEEQIVSEIATNEFDIEMDYIVTNQRYIKCKGEK